MPYLRALGAELPSGEVLVAFLRCELRGPDGDALVFFTRPRMLICKQDQRGVPCDAQIGLQAMQAEARNLFNRPYWSRA